MFRGDNHINISEVRQMFQFEELEFDVQSDIANMFRIAFSESEERFDNFELTDSDYENIYDHLNSCFVSFLKSVSGSLFISDHISNIIGVGCEILFHTSSGGRNYVFLDDEFFCVDAKSGSVAIKAAETLLKSKDIICLYSEVYDELLQLSKLSWYFQKLEPFHGFYLCIERDVAPDARTMRGLVGLNGYDGPQAGPALGRPRKIDDAKEAYLRCFPSGHDGRTWKMVQATLRDKGGVDASEDTIRRAVASLKK